MQWGWGSALGACLFLIGGHLLGATKSPDASGGIRKIEDIVVYEDARFYSSFPSIVKARDGELLVAFRRAPDRRTLGTPGVTHTDPNSYLVLVRSRDAGKSWSPEPQLLYAHPFGGSQDPCMIQLRDGTLVCTSYGWASFPPEAIGKLQQPVARAGNFVFLGGYLMRSRDAGHSWAGPIIPPSCPGEFHLDPFGHVIAAYNRGAMCEGRDGRLYWVVAVSNTNAPGKTGTHLLVSRDKGDTWNYSCPVAVDPKVPSTKRQFTKLRKAIWSPFFGRRDLAIAPASRDRRIMDEVFSGRRPDFRGTRITPCACRTVGCSWCMGIGTRRSGFGRAYWMPNAPTRRVRRRLCCATTAATGTWVTRGPRFFPRIARWWFTISTARTARAISRGLFFNSGITNDNENYLSAHSAGFVVSSRKISGGRYSANLQ